MPDWLLISIIASVALTVLANLVPRLFPRLGERAEQRFLREMEEASQPGRSKVRVVFPWKTMLVVSALGTLALNLFV